MKIKFRSLQKKIIIKKKFKLLAYNSDTRVGPFRDPTSKLQFHKDSIEVLVKTQIKIFFTQK